MKKIFAVLLSAVLLLPVLVGCQQSDSATTLPPVETVSPSVKPDVETEPAVQYITPDEAKAIALNDAGLKEADIHDLEIELDRDGVKVHYDVDFDKGSDDYDYEIDAVTGDILHVQKPAQQAAYSSTNSSSSTKQLTKAEAKAIAFKHAGVKESEVRDLEVELDKDDGVLHFDVDFEKDGYDYDYEIDATSGKILKSRKERD